MKITEIIRRKVNETASVGGTSAGGVAAVATPLFKKPVKRKVKEINAVHLSDPDKAIVKKQPNSQAQRKRRFRTLIWSWIKTSQKEHDAYLNRGNPRSDKVNKKANKELVQINRTFKKEFRDLIPKEDLHDFNLGFYNFSESSMDEIVNAWFNKPETGIKGK